MGTCKSRHMDRGRRGGARERLAPNLNTVLEVIGFMVADEWKINIIKLGIIYNLSESS